VFVFVTVGVAFAAVNTGNNLLYLMLGLMLSLLLLSMVLSENALEKLRVERRLPKRAFAGSPVLVELELANDKRFLPSYSLEVEDRATEDPTDRRCFFLKVSAKGSQRAAYRRVPSRRGELFLSGYRIVTRYPFGLVEKARTYTSEAKMLVYPALVPVDPALLRGLREGAEQPTPRIGLGTEVAGLRGYQLGDEARAIHWRRTATLGRVVVKERERDAASRVTFVLDEARPDGAGDAWDAAFEGAVSEAASLAAAALASGCGVEMVTRGGASPVVLPGSPPDPIFTLLALVRPMPEKDAPPFRTVRGDRRVVPVRGGRRQADEGALTGDARRRR
jgi:uncharacterized protein (DUF58 family)